MPTSAWRSEQLPEEGLGVAEGAQLFAEQGNVEVDAPFVVARDERIREGRSQIRIAPKVAAASGDDLVQVDVLGEGPEGRAVLRGERRHARDRRTPGSCAIPIPAAWSAPTACFGSSNSTAAWHASKQTPRWRRRAASASAAPRPDNATEPARRRRDRTGAPRRRPRLRPRSRGRRTARARGRGRSACPCPAPGRPASTRGVSAGRPWPATRRGPSARGLKQPGRC